MYFQVKLSNKWRALPKLILCLLLIVLAVLGNSCSSNIAISDYTGNVSIKVVGKQRSDHGSACLPFATEEELFSAADYIFSGKITRIQNIEIDCNGVKLYKSLIKMSVDQFLKGDYDTTDITVMAGPVGGNRSGADLLDGLKKGDYGIFMAEAVAVDTYYEENNCTWNVAELCQAMFADDDRFGFIKESGTNAECRTSKSAYSSLTSYEWESVIEYTEKMISQNELEDYK